MVIRSLPFIGVSRPKMSNILQITIFGLQISAYFTVSLKIENQPKQVGMLLVPIQFIKTLLKYPPNQLRNFRKKYFT